MMNGPFFPIFNDFDDGFIGSPYYRSHGGYGFNPMIARKAAEERHRQAEMERYNQWKQQQWLLQQREQQEQEQEAIRLAHEDYLRRRREEKEKLRRQAQHPPAYAIVRGPGGHLYRVPVEQHDDETSVCSRHSIPERRVPRNASPPTKQPRRSEQPTYVRCPDGRIYIVKQPDAKVDNIENTLHETEPEPSKASPISNPNGPSDRVTVEINPNSGKDAGNVQVTVKNNENNDGKNNRRRVTVIVEDVPESEVEEETKSIWCNRRPGPGESWMEPINL
jgi:hypothetical protein